MLRLVHMPYSLYLWAVKVRAPSSAPSPHTSAPQYLLSFSAPLTPTAPAPPPGRSTTAATSLAPS